jgi:hypothetical protein
MTKVETILMDEKFKGLTSLMNAQFTNVQDKLEEIKVQKIQIDNRLFELEKWRNNHSNDCPLVPKIRVLEDNQLTTNTVKKWILTSITATAGVVTIIFMVIKILFGE